MIDMIYETYKTKDYRKIFNPLWLLLDVGILILKALCKIIQGFFWLLGICYAAVGWLFSFVLNVLLFIFVIGFGYSVYAFFHDTAPINVVVTLGIFLVSCGILKFLSDTLDEIFISIGEFVGDLCTDIALQSPVRYKTI